MYSFFCIIDEIRRNRPFNGQGKKKADIRLRVDKLGQPENNMLTD